MKMNSTIFKQYSWDDPQGIDFNTSINSTIQEKVHMRERARQQVDFQIRSSPLLTNATSIRRHPLLATHRRRFLEVKSYIKIEKMSNYHMQLHNNLRVITPSDVVYPSKTSGLMHINTHSMQQRILLSAEGITCMDRLRNFMLVGHSEGDVSLVDLETATTVNKFKLNCNGELINSIKFLDDRTGGLKTIIGGNEYSVDIFDLEKSTVPIRSIKVDYYVNDLVLSKDKTMMALAYDAEQIDVLDLRCSKRVHSLKGHEDYSFAVDFDDSGYTLASGNQDLTTRLWDLRTGQCSLIIPTRASASSVLRYIQNSKYLVVGEAMNYVSVYDRSLDYKVYGEIDFFGELVGIDFGVSQSEMFVGVGKMYAEASPGIMRVSLGNPRKGVEMLDEKETEGY